MRWALFYFRPALIYFVTETAVTPDDQASRHAHRFLDAGPGYMPARPARRHRSSSETTGANQTEDQWLRLIGPWPAPAEITPNEPCSISCRSRDAELSRPPWPLAAGVDVFLAHIPLNLANQARPKGMFHVKHPHKQTPPQLTLRGCFFLAPGDRQDRDLLSPQTCGTKGRLDDARLAAVKSTRYECLRQEKIVAIHQHPSDLNAPPLQPKPVRQPGKAAAQI